MKALLQSALRSEWPRLIGFAVVGAGGFIVHAGMVMILTAFTAFGALFSWFPAFIIAVAFTWVMNRILTFKGLGRGQSKRQQAASYLTVQGLGAALNFGVYAGLIKLALPLISHPLFALAAGSGLAMIFNYLALRFFVFPNQKG